MRWTKSRKVDRSAAAADSLPLAASRGGTYLQLVTSAEISLTESAARRVAAIAARKDKAPILRLSVDGGGCAGFTYKFDLAEAAEPDDAIAETDGVKLVVDPISLDLVKGSAVDFVEDLSGAAFRVTNPNAQSGCGCGSSFSV